MKFESKAVHFADRKRGRKLGDASVPVTTPIHTATSYVHDSMEALDRVFAGEQEGQSYGRHDNPTRNALADLVSALEGGAGAVACASGMSALHLALLAALLDRPKRVVAANALYGATTNMLMSVFGPMGVETTLADVCDPPAFEEAVAEAKPGAVLIETISNPLLRVAPMDKIAEICARAGAPLIVDNTFATPVMVRPLEFGANIVVHSATKYLAGHGDVLGGVAVADAANFPAILQLMRTIGPALSPFDSYLTMRGIKTLPLRVERQCANACKVASWLSGHPKVERVYFTGDPQHPDAATIARLFPKNLQGAMLAFDIKGAGRAEVFRFMEALMMIVPATSLGDVHTMALYPAISTHRDISAKMRARLGIGDGLVRMSIGIEAAEDIISDLEQAFR
ncbi:MAG TPA: aminotransferase class I/II-fold pyridoxal phosphate-dependent enzyme [Bryobacteraceae bacterium]|nr:aminotransferase class I/II-fold pyridoxal phosphate-dependent enzyme [Bryobacteraceae bacterium]